MMTDLDHAARPVLIAVADSALRAVVLAGVAGAMLMLVRRRGAALRLRAWTVVLCAALALPVLTVIVPTWNWPVPGTETWWAPAAPASSSGVVAPSTPVVAASVRQNPAGISGLTVAAAIYIAGVTWLLLWTCLGWLAARRLRVSARPISVAGDADAIARLDRHAARAGLARSPHLVESPSLLVPVTTSVVRPVVALPADWRDWPAPRLEAVMAHEVAHIARRDALTQRLSLAYRAIFWFSPLSWWLHRHVSDLADQASDEAALHAGIDPTTYAETLLDCFARLQQGPRLAGLHVAMATRRDDSDAARRVERVLSWKGGAVMTRSKWVLAGLVMVVASVAAVTGAVRLVPAAAPLPTPPIVDPAPVSQREAPTALFPPQPAKVPAVTERAAAGESGVRRATPPVVKNDPRPEKATVASEPPQPTGPKPAKPSSEEPIQGVYDFDTPGLIAPKVIREFKPRYTPDAMRAKIQGEVKVEIIILQDGTVGQARVLESLDTITGLDQEALIAARRWTFTPARLNDTVVPVRAQIELTFRLH